MTRVQTGLLWFFVGAALATIAAWWATDGNARGADPRHPRLDSSIELAAIRDRLDQISRRMAERPEPVLPPEAPRPTGPDPALAEIQARLTAIEAAFARLGERRPTKPDSSIPAGAQEPPADPPPRIPAPKPKDQRLIDDLLAKGAREPGANGRTYFGLTPREIQQVLGKPDNTKWDTAAGHHDWFYFDAAGATALQVRFEGGVVVGVWP